MGTDIYLLKLNEKKANKIIDNHSNLAYYTNNTLCTAYKSTVQTEQAMDCNYWAIRGAGPYLWQQMNIDICGTVVYYYCSTGVFYLE